MERHSARPWLENFQGWAAKSGIVEQHIAKPAADDHCRRAPQHEVVAVVGVIGAGPPQSFANALTCVRRARRQDADDVGERIPVDRERS